MIRETGAGTTEEAAKAAIRRRSATLLSASQRAELSFFVLYGGQKELLEGFSEEGFGRTQTIF